MNQHYPQLQVLSPNTVYNCKNMTNSSSKPTMPFIKAHATGNDFVVIDSAKQILELTDQDVVSLCHRHTGIGADGLLRIAKASDYSVSDAHFFMDYRNADGTIAETCGNGLRVFARLLVELGYEKPGTFTIGTRAGTIRVTVSPDDVNFENISVQMGKAESHNIAKITVQTESGLWDGKGVFMPNPHCVVKTEDLNSVGTLLQAPEILPSTAFPEGVNVEFIEPLGEQHIAMRTFERGVGETLSCGSGACAAASIWARDNDLKAPWTIQVDVLGGTVFIDSALDGILTLRGPASVVATGFAKGNEWQI